MEKAMKELEHVLFVFTDALNGTKVYGNFAQAHEELIEFAVRYNLLIHRHSGTWAGNSLSTAYPVGGDMLLDAQASVRVARR